MFYVLQEKEGELAIKVNQETRLDNRILDLRTPTIRLFFAYKCAVCRLFREALPGPSEIVSYLLFFIVRLQYKYLFCGRRCMQEMTVYLS